MDFLYLLQLGGRVVELVLDDLLRVLERFRVAEHVFCRGLERLVDGLAGAQLLVFLFGDFPDFLCDVGKLFALACDDFGVVLLDDIGVATRPTP